MASGQGGGRPRQFDVAAAIDEALLVFWKHGYEGASLTQLTTAMGINRPALYSAFGSKHELFLRAVERYYQGDAAHTAQALELPSVAQVVTEYLHRNVDQVTGPDHPPGCFVVQTGLSCGPENEAVRVALAENRRSSERALRERFDRARDEADLNPAIDPADLAGYVSAISEGLSVQASDGASAGQLHRHVDLAVQLMIPALKMP